MKKGKFKAYLKEHSDEIKAVACYVGGVIVAGAAGYVIGRRLRENEVIVNSEIIKKVFTDIPDGTKVNIFGGIKREGLVADALGELGKAIVEEGASDTDAFTHFIAIGKVAEP